MTDITFEVRDEIMLFARALENNMRYNEARGKGDEWKRRMDPPALFDRLMDEIDELSNETLGGLPFNEPNIRHESLDVATLAFFQWQNSLIRDAEKGKLVLE